MPTVLMLSANPKGTTPLRLDEELREVKEGLIKRAKLRDSFSLVSEHALRTRDLYRAMLEHQPHILHFSGHGTGAKGLILEDESGEGKEVSGEAIARLLGLFKDSLQCVLLNACYSEVQAKAISEHIPFVIGMSEEIGDKAAIEFAVAFYDAIGAGRDIKFAFDLATVAIKLAGIDQDHTGIKTADKLCGDRLLYLQPGYLYWKGRRDADNLRAASEGFQDRRHCRHDGGGENGSRGTGDRTISRRCALCPI